jgi:two-component system nitrogen regulation sensor histidine kinase GlnL
LQRNLRNPAGIQVAGSLLLMSVVSKLFSSRAADEAAAACAGIDLLATAVLMLDAARRVTYANPAAENLFELAKKHLVGHRPEQVFTDASGLSAAIDKAVRGGRPTPSRSSSSLSPASRTSSHLHGLSGGDEGSALLLEFRTYRPAA